MADHLATGRLEGSGQADTPHKFVRHFDFESVAAFREAAHNFK